MKRLMFLMVCGVVISTLSHTTVCTLQAQTAGSKPLPLIVGTWKLNPEKSNLRSHRSSL